MSSSRHIGDIQTIGQSERITFTLTTTPWGSAPTGVVVTAYDVSAGMSAGVLVTGTILSGAGSVSGDVITLPTIINVTPGTLYRIEVLFVSGGQTFEPYLLVRGEV